MKGDVLEERLLEEGLENLNLVPGIGRKAINLLNAYIAEIELFNPAYGLVKVDSRRELIVKHILDSLAPLGMLRSLAAGRDGKSSADSDAAKGDAGAGSCVGRAGNVPLCENVAQSEASGGRAGKSDANSNAAKGGDPAGSCGALRVADIGSGAGLPGIPLAIFMPEWEFTLVERMGRRSGFLQNCIALLGLGNVKVLEADLDELVRKGSSKNSFDIIVFRAFKNIDKELIKTFSSILSPCGFIGAYKGRRETIDKEINEIGELCKVSPIPLAVPFLNEERHLLVIQNASV